jgi:predicted nuclease with TOPRIM domain
MVNPGRYAGTAMRPCGPTESFDDLPYLELARRSHRLYAEDDATMADTSDAAMMERLERVETKIDRLETRFDHLETRFDRLEGRFDRLETRVDGLAIKIDVQTEHVRDDIRRLAESMGGVIERLDRQHAEGQAQTATRFADHELVLRDYGRRITALEPPRS